MIGAHKSAATRGIALLGALGASFFLLMSVSSASTSTESLDLNTYASPSTGMAGPVTTAMALTSGSTYSVTVSGAYSAYNQQLMNGEPGWKVCGTPIDAKGSGVGGNHLEGQDAEFIFAKPKHVRAFCPKTPFLSHAFVISTDGPRGPFVAYTPNGGDPTAVNPRHRYTYTITGTGHPASFGILDSNTTDNYGTLRIRVRG